MVEQKHKKSWREAISARLSSFREQRQRDDHLEGLVMQDGPIHYDTPPSIGSSFRRGTQRKSQTEDYSPLRFPTGLSVITPDISKALEELYVAHHSPLTPIAEEGSPAA